MHICIHLYVIRDICKSLLIIKVNQRNIRTVRKYDVGRNGKTIIKRLYNFSHSNEQKKFLKNFV
jgi:hypothetical protein